MNSFQAFSLLQFLADMDKVGDRDGLLEQLLVPSEGDSDFLAVISERFCGDGGIPKAGGPGEQHFGGINHYYYCN